jgi:hypothetical protein
MILPLRCLHRRAAIALWTLPLVAMLAALHRYWAS